MNLDEIRKQIDEIDGQLLELFCRRMDLVKDVAAYKIENGMPVFRPEREKSILENVSNRAGAEYGIYAAELFQCLMEVSREMQTQIMEEYETIIFCRIRLILPWQRLWRKRWQMKR